MSKDKIIELKVESTYMNKKTKNLYKVLSLDVVNTTNTDDGIMMVLYTDDTGILYVRELNEFIDKFSFSHKG